MVRREILKIEFFGQTFERFFEKAPQVLFPLVLVLL